MTELIRIKRAVLAGRYVLTEKAGIEMDACDLLDTDIIESIACAKTIYKRLRSTSPLRDHHTEYLYIIISPNLSGICIYTKGKLVVQDGVETYYLLVSAKHAK